jgi:putative restriction endonuclease
MTLETQDVVLRFRSLATWSRAGQRAPHKPLLCLLAISKLFSENPRLLPYRIIEKPLRDLLTEFGPPRKVCHPEYPFWALQHDRDIWEFRASSLLPQESGAFPTRAALLRSNAEAGFRSAIYLALKEDEGVRFQIITELLESHFPETIHEDILQSLGLTTVGQISKGNDRDPEFRDKVLSAYEYRCAICGFNVRIGQIVVALEAAHIKWHQAGGPDIHENGLALCSLHHKLFDRGAFTVDKDRCALISERAYGTEGFVEHLGRFHRKPLLAPNRESYRPKLDFLSWHMNQVFLLPSRE